MNGTTLHPLLLLFASALQVFAAESTVYSHGNPTAEEQYMLELINRARADPEAEGRFLSNLKDPDIKFAIDFFNVDRVRLKSDFASYARRPPLAFNAKLLASSRRHSKDMAENNFQDHIGSDGSTIGDRVGDAGYSASAFSESIYSNLVSTALFAHAGLNIDWGVGDGGVQPGVGHRRSIMGFGSTDYREIGISIVSRSGADAEEFGKLSVTQDFANRFDSPNFFVGVAYYDVNANGICDPGEGLPGIKVKPYTGSWHAVTSASGGYAIPLPEVPEANGVTFSGGGLKSPVSKILFLAGDNVKLDLRITSGGPFVALKPLDKIANESGGTARFRITRVGPITGELKVFLTSPTLGGIGNGLPQDYRLSAVSPALVKENKTFPGRFAVTIPANRASAEIKLTALPDKLTEPMEGVGFIIDESKNYRTDSPQSVIISIKP